MNVSKSLNAEFLMQSKTLDPFRNSKQLSSRTNIMSVCKITAVSHKKEPYNTNSLLTTVK